MDSVTHFDFHKVVAIRLELLTQLNDGAAMKIISTFDPFLPPKPHKAATKIHKKFM